MNLPEQYQKQLSHSKGYLELEMFDEAWRVLDQFDAQFQTYPDVLNLRLKIVIASKKWKTGVTLGRSMCELYPKDEVAFILTAQCLYELKKIREAKEILLSGPPSLRETALFHYNLGCYYSELGEITEAEKSIKIAIEMDKALRKIALEDPSLKAIRNLLT